MRIDKSEYVNINLNACAEQVEGPVVEAVLVKQIRLDIPFARPEIHIQIHHTWKVPVFPPSPISSVLQASPYKFVL